MTWYLARALGIVAYALLTASMLWGLWLSTRVPSRRGRPWLLEVHRALGGLAVLFTLGHLGALLADSYVDLAPVEVLVPFAGDWQPAAVAGGVVALYLLLAVEVTSLLRRSLARRTWRKVHLAAFGAYLMATAHFLSAGTDAGGRLALSLTLAGLALVATGTIHRVTDHLARPAESPRPRTPTKETPWTPPPPPMSRRPSHRPLPLPPHPPMATVDGPLASVGGPPASAPPPSRSPVP